MKEALGFAEVNKDTCYVAGTALECRADVVEVGSGVEKGSLPKICSVTISTKEPRVLAYGPRPTMVGS
jgi:hypothetical protein